MNKEGKPQSNKNPCNRSEIVGNTWTFLLLQLGEDWSKVLDRVNDLTTKVKESTQKHVRAVGETFLGTDGCTNFPSSKTSNLCGIPDSIL